MIIHTILQVQITKKEEKGKEIKKESDKMPELTEEEYSTITFVGGSHRLNAIRRIMEEHKEKEENNNNNN